LDTAVNHKGSAALLWVSVGGVYVVENHHHVLSAWAQFRAQADRAPRLITLDHHTDTSPAFRTYCKTSKTSADTLLAAIDFRDLRSIEAAIDKLDRDEHVVAALRSDILAAAFVVAQNAMDTGRDVFLQHRIACREIRDDQWDQVLESAVLDKAIAGFEAVLGDSLFDRPYILDIDLDYFKTFASIAPKDAATIRRLAAHASLITVATEPSFVKHCAVDRGLDSEYLLAKLQALLA